MALPILAKRHESEQYYLRMLAAGRALDAAVCLLRRKQRHELVITLACAIAARRAHPCVVTVRRAVESGLSVLITPANVLGLKKIREFFVDEKIDVSPLVIGERTNYDEHCFR